MGSLYRSEEMCRCQIFFQTESVYLCTAKLGEIGVVQFRDLNPDVNAFQRKFVDEVRRCEDMERKLKFIEKEIKKNNIEIFDPPDDPTAPHPREINDLTASFDTLEIELKEINANEETMKKDFLELTEFKYVLRKATGFFDEGRTIEQEFISQVAVDEDTGIPLGLTGGGAPHMQFVAGCVPYDRALVFERLLWRACRGNMLFRQAQITEELLENPNTGEFIEMCAFITFFQGDVLKTKIKKICDGFKVKTYNFPESHQERREIAHGIMTRMEDIKTVLGQTQSHRMRLLNSAAQTLRTWMTQVFKMKSIYHTMNLFNLDVTQKCLIAECWCPVFELERIQDALKSGLEESGGDVTPILNRMECDESPPTFNKVNKFTAGFQAIVDAYGVGDYREVNPSMAPYTIITFPFLFAVMFGDFGHGMLMALFAGFLVFKEKWLISKKIRDEIFDTFFGGRYIILLMGCFAMYTGFIYNDLYAKSVNIYGSNWVVNVSNFDVANNVKLQLDPKTSYIGSPYPWGIDPIWSLAENKLNFLNSFKMKMSVILGIFQMLFGVVLSLLNYRYFNEPLDIYFQFIPQLLFLSCIFLYLCIVIFYKWTHFTVFEQQMSVGLYPGPHCAPSLLIGLINMLMFKSRKEGFEGNTCFLNSYYSGQSVVETILVLVAVLSVPCMLLVKPFILKHRHNRQSRYEVHANLTADDAEVIETKQNGAGGAQGGGHGEKFDFGEIFIHQAIHTIEFCLGCISHTASYLRLWALSLAHAQLSEVLWQMVMMMAFKSNSFSGCIGVYLIFMAFAALTVAVLIVMEALSAFLHALRLHWVEFQSKFYGGGGYPFAPFSFKDLLELLHAGEE